MFDKPKKSLYQGLMPHIFCVRISSQLKEIRDKEKQQFRPNSLPLNKVSYWRSKLLKNVFRSTRKFANLYNSLNIFWCISLDMQNFWHFFAQGIWITKNPKRVKICCVVLNISIDNNSSLQNFCHFFEGAKMKNNNNNSRESHDLRVRLKINKYTQNYSL